jgi:transcriptional regulator with XRE-family HTH domain
MGGPSSTKNIDPVAHRLRARREQLGLSQSELARRSGTQQSAISDMETGEASPTLRTLRKVVKYLKLDIELVELSPASILRDIIYLRSLEPDQLETELLNRKWYVHPNDLIGGFCVMPVDAPPSSGCFEIAESMSEGWAKHITELHNSEIDRPAYEPPSDDRDPSCVLRWPSCSSGEYHPDCCRFPKSCSC